MAILWLDASSGPTIAALNEGYEIGNPKAGENTHLIDHTWLALVATAGLTHVEYRFVRQAVLWQMSIIVDGESTDTTADPSMFEGLLAEDSVGTTVIVEVEHTPGRMTSDEYAEGESVTMLVAIPIHASLKSLYSDFSSLQGFVGGFTADKEILEGKVSTLESDNSSLSTTVSTLESDSATLNTTVSGLETDLGSLSSANDTLSSTVSTLEGNVATLTSDKEALEGQVSTLESTVGDLTSDKEALEGQVSTLESTIADFTARLEALETPTSPE